MQIVARKAIWSFCLVVLFLVRSGDAIAGELSQRLTNFPRWEKLTSVQPATGDLVYPDWMAGSWKVTSTLVDLVAPLAPEIVTKEMGLKPRPSRATLI